MTTHTKGPWHVSEGKGNCFHAGNRYAIYHKAEEDEPGIPMTPTIAEVWPTSSDADRADAYLIAAAPALLAMVRAISEDPQLPERWKPALDQALALASAPDA